jgi:3-hydroxyisobutyrate dehydrogenase-like beta-hydroxyacid dehydrogenase
MAQTDKREPVGIIGLGLLGGAIARRLLAAGHPVLDYDVDQTKAASLASAELQTTDVATIAQRCERIVLAVFTSEQVGEVAAQLYAAGAPRLLICTTTCDPTGSIAHGVAALAQGWRYVEAPLSGTSAQVLAGDGVGLVAGEAGAIYEAADLFDTICPRWHRVGAVGDAGRAKLAVNLILGLNRLALAEGLVFAQRQGLDGAAFLDIVRDSAAYSQVMDTKGAKMLERDFSAEGRAEQALKDVKMMQAQAARLGQPLPLLAVHQAVLEACIGHGEGALDSSVVIEEIRRRGNQKESH